MSNQNMNANLRYQNKIESSNNVLISMEKSPAKNMKMTYNQQNDILSVKQ